MRDFFRFQFRSLSSVSFFAVRRRKYHFGKLIYLYVCVCVYVYGEKLCGNYVCLLYVRVTLWRNRHRVAIRVEVPVHW